MSSDHAHYWSVFFLCVDSLCLSSWDFSIEHVFASVYPAIWQVCSDDICSVASVIQVIIPILPGGISSVAGMLMFGNGFGLLYSCIGLVIGEAIGFLLVRYYGVAFVQLILSPKKYQKFDELLTRKTKDIKKVLVVTLLLPFAPDDLICLVAGLTKLSFREFMQIVIFLKPWSVGVYSMIMLFLFHQAQGHL